ncbi:ribosome assembly RNA-binding protein YhbY [Natranaerovirga pectinivora]|uniref:ribosome assembly RNA-binding protein YhbY n=1 Tax=Natranaerovirga pectinivora TaxID=682400 RepID=UPI00104CCFF6|nr:ribosome assembly RNA-binding protein YhbY [Natranaerovirga pectinivora]
MTSKQRAQLKSLAHNIEPIFQIGKSGITPDLTKAIAEALEARELIKISVLKNCYEEPKEMAIVLSERTKSIVVQVIGRKIILYKKSKDKPKIEL